MMVETGVCRETASGASAVVRDVTPILARDGSRLSSEGICRPNPIRIRALELAIGLNVVMC
ncbi:hypothetical protein ThidrDRAFT_0433 [Thiorhodococcus drewsii AZ1]|uniref:Uncharacterized protein n=1 Tax=Thiorhodococcus drewsii AZ1 TaxID=765913 RepID=G2DWP4_9GAMM|nr:hypothetical protein ThidrDRAFT_0433 [Thiorhodococcus drewsii AZ1]